MHNKDKHYPEKTVLCTILLGNLLTLLPRLKAGEIKNEKEKHLGWIEILGAVVHPAIYAFFIAFFYLLYKGSDKNIFLALNRLTVLIYILVVFLLLRRFNKGDKDSKMYFPQNTYLLTSSC